MNHYKLQKKLSDSSTAVDATMIKDQVANMSRQTISGTDGKTLMRALYSNHRIPNRELEDHQPQIPDDPDTIRLVATEVGLYQDKLRRNQHAAFLAAQNALRDAILEALPPSWHQAKANDTTPPSFKPLHELYTAICNLAVMTDQALRDETKKLRQIVPNDKDPINVFFTQSHSQNAAMRAHNINPSDRDYLILLKDTLGQNPSFLPALERYNNATAFSQQTPENFRTFMEEADTRRTRTPTTGVTFSINAVKANTNGAEKIAKLEKEVATLTATLAKNNNKARGGNGNRGSGDRTTRPLAPYEYYCHTHGPNRSHNSPSCSQPREGHNTAATADNRLGGPDVHTSYKTQKADP